MRFKTVAEILLDEPLARMAAAEDNVFFEARRNDSHDRCSFRWGTRQR
jgi:hypothetical protein